MHEQKAWGVAFKSRDSKPGARTWGGSPKDNFEIRNLNPPRSVPCKVVISFQYVTFASQFLNRNSPLKIQ